ncbi:MAG TPA: DUF4430 domain-containing protein [Gaiellaceae bacterium]|nr:DUF4430 domain-containing protein [Gaiellaceae bacterium]
MLRRSLVLVAALAAALALVPFAAAALVHVRVEGKTLTLFGSNDPKVVAATPLDALQAAARAGEFYVHVTSSSFGNYVDQIGFYPGAGDAGWVFKVNDVSPPVGADQVQLKDGDTVEWYWAAFGPTGGPPTLGLYRKAGCYRVAAFDDQGRESAAPNTVLHVDGRQIKASFTGTCIGPHHGLVWATAPGAVRSNRLP